MTVRPKDLLRLRHLQQRRHFRAEELPADVTAAYDMAAATLGLMARPVAAWKLGATTAGTRKAFQTDEVYYGGLVSEEVWSAESAKAPTSAPLFRGEAEIALRLSINIDAGDHAAAMAQGADMLFDAWCLAIECPYSCVENIPEAGLPALLMDRCAAGRLFLGAPRRGIGDIDIGAPIAISIDGVCAARADARSALLLTPIAAALRFLEIAAAQGVSVRRGQWISTGGITPCIDLPFDKPVSLHFADEEVFTIALRAPEFEPLT